MIFRQRPTLPHSHPCSTIGAEELNFRVRDGNGCFLFAIATEKNIYLYWNFKLDDLVKSRKIPLFVIPAKAGIQ